MIATGRRKKTVDTIPRAVLGSKTAAKHEGIAMKLEVGKYYKTRDGRKVGPMRFDDTWGGYVCSNSGMVFCPNGIHGDAVDVFASCIDNEPDYDLIAEWTDEPAQLTAIDHLRKAAELFLTDGNDKAAFDVLGVVLDHE